MKIHVAVINESWRQTFAVEYKADKTFSVQF